METQKNPTTDLPGRILLTYLRKGPQSPPRIQTCRPGQESSASGRRFWSPPCNERWINAWLQIKLKYITEDSNTYLRKLLHVTQFSHSTKTWDITVNPLDRAVKYWHTCRQPLPSSRERSCPVTSVVGGLECSRSAPPGPWIWWGRGCTRSPRCFVEHRRGPGRAERAGWNRHPTVYVCLNYIHKNVNILRDWIHCKSTGKLLDKSHFPLGMSCIQVRI